MKETIDEMLALIENPSACFWSHSYDSVQVPFPISCASYLEFAETDLKDVSERGLINALSNAKRSLDARIESVLASFGVHKIAKKGNWNIPKKLEYLSKLGILAPRILTKLNQTRNLIEHEFHCPTREQVEDFVDVVALFNESTKVYLSNLPNDAEIGIDDEEEWFAFRIDRNEGKIVLARGKFEIPSDDPYYERFIISYAKMIRRLYE